MNLTETSPIPLKRRGEGGGGGRSCSIWQEHGCDGRRILRGLRGGMGVGYDEIWDRNTFNLDGVGVWGVTSMGKSGIERK